MMKIQCTDYLKTLAGHIGNTLSDKEEKKVEGHLADCDDCRKLFVITNELIRDDELSEWELIDPYKARYIWENFEEEPETADESGVEPALAKTRGTGDPLSPEELPGSKIENVLEDFCQWITAPFSELPPLLDFAPVRSEQKENLAKYFPPNPPLVREFDELTAEIYGIMNAGESEFRIGVSVLENNESAKGVRLALGKTGTRGSSRLYKGDYEIFDELPFGPYFLTLKQGGKERGSIYFEVSSEGFKL